MPIDEPALKTALEYAAQAITPDDTTTPPEPTPGLPDFRHTDFYAVVNGEVTDTLTEGDRVSFGSVSTNIGGDAEPGTVFDLGVYFADPGAPPIIAEPTVWDDTHLSGVAAGEVVTLTTTGGPAGVNYWTATPGTHDVWGVVDPNAALLGRYTESDTTNNTLHIELTVKANDVPVEPPTGDAGGKQALVNTRGAYSYTGGGPNGSYMKTAMGWYGGPPFEYACQNLQQDPQSQAVANMQFCLAGYGPGGTSGLTPVPVMAFGLAAGGTGPPPAGQNLADVANGAWDTYWAQIAELGKGFTQGRVYRLGWEFNGTWYAWNITGTQNGVPRPECTPANHKKAFTRARDIIHDIDPHAKFDWCLNGGIGLYQSWTGVDPRAAYPGGDKVDYIGCDIYETMPAGGRYETLEADWNWLQTFARDEAASGGKPVTYPEFGLFLPPHENVTDANHLPWLTKLADLMEQQPASGPGSLGYHLVFEVDAPSAASNWAGMHGVSVAAADYWATRIT